MSSSTSSQEKAGADFAEAGQMFTRMWTDFASKMAASGMAPPSGEASADMARQMRDTFFAAWTDACDRYMRSEEFRQMMRESMSAAIELRKQLNQQLGDFQHTMQGASRQDVDRLLQSIDSLETRVNETLEQLMRRLQSLDERLASVEQQRSTGKQAATGQRKKQTTKKKTNKKTASKQSTKRSR